MKIICRDNYDRDNISDKLIAEHVNPHYGERIVRLLNTACLSAIHDEHFNLVDDDYKLYKFEP